MTKILITGAKGQIGSDLLDALRAEHGADAVLATDIHTAAGDEAGPFEILDVRDAARMRELVERNRIDTVYHLASILSAAGERKPELCWDVNMNGLRNVLAMAGERGLRVFWPSSIAAFGPATPRENTPQVTVLDPTTMYGVTKVSGELLCRYAHQEHGVDVRSVRFPGIISHTTPPGGGTTDFAVNIFHEALERGSYTCFVREATRLPMMYMPDAVRSILEIMRAEADAITVRTSYNLGAMSFSAAELAEEIGRHVPGFECRYEPDFRQQIADSWPAAVDDSLAREDWGWRHRYDLPEMVEDMLANLRVRLSGAAGARPSDHS
jgi:nucleoside-diphosphate-sugar epimerase